MKRMHCVLLASVVMLAACAGGDNAVQPKDDSSSSEIAKSSSSSVKRSSSSAKSSSSSSVSQGVVDPSTVVKGFMTDSRDGQTYKTVTIGSQTWMAENLNFATKKSLCYRKADSNCTKFGRFYTWYDAVDCDVDDERDRNSVRKCESSSPVRGVCPEGWHLPSLKEWQSLETAVGGYDTAGGKLKSISGWLDDGNGTDDYSFSVIPAWSSENVELHNGEEGGESVYFWSSTTDYESEGDYRTFSAYTAFLYFDFDFWLLDPTSKTQTSSVRCLKD